MAGYLLSLARYSARLSIGLSYVGQAVLKTPSSQLAKCTGSYAGRVRFASSAESRMTLTPLEYVRDVETSREQVRKPRLMKNYG